MTYARLQRGQDMYGTYFEVHDKHFTCTHGGWTGYFHEGIMYYDLSMDSIVAEYPHVKYMDEAEYTLAYDDEYGTLK